jgi:hypothetical protein
VEVAHRHLEHERLNDGGSSFDRVPTETHPSSKLAGTPIGDDETSRRWGTRI